MGSPFLFEVASETDFGANSRFDICDDGLASNIVFVILDVTVKKWCRLILLIIILIRLTVALFLTVYLSKGQQT